MNNLLLIAVTLLTVNFSFSQQLEESLSGSNQQVIEVENETTGWAKYKVFDGVLVEYKQFQCLNGNDNNQSWVVFRYSNLTNDLVELNWVSTWKRNDECVNCDRLDDYEFSHKLVVEAGEILEGEPCLNKDQRFYIFSHFINIYPGMDNKKLTAFEFLNVEVKQINK